MKTRIITNLTDNKEVDPRTIALLSLIYGTNSAGQVFNMDELENLMGTIRGMVEGESVGRSISESIQIITDALMRNYIVNFYSY